MKGENARFLLGVTLVTEKKSIIAINTSYKTLSAVLEEYYQGKGIYWV